MAEHGRHPLAPNQDLGDQEGDEAACRFGDHFGVSTGKAIGEVYKIAIPLKARCRTTP